MRNQALDEAKAIAAYSVVLLHIRFPGEAGAVVNAIARFAVPFFFLISGYFCYRSADGDILKRMPGKIKHILYLSLLAVPFYIVWECIQRGIEGEAPFKWMGDLLKYENIKNFILYNRTSPIRPHLWFLFALLYCYLLFCVVEKFRLHKMVYLLIPILLAGNFWMGANSGEAGDTYRIMEFRNYLFTGFPFFMLGHLLHRCQGKLQERIPYQAWGILAAAGGALSAAEYFLVGQRELFVGSVLLSMGFFLFAVCSKRRSVSGGLCRIGEKYTFTIYVLHLAVGDFWEDIAVFMHAEDLGFYQWTCPAVVCILTTFLAVGLNRVFKSLRKFSEK